MAEIPHFMLPFRFNNGAAVVTEQDDTDEIVSCAVAVLLCPVGSRVELPTFGVPDPTFSQGIPPTEVIEAALTEWEPRAHQITEAWIDELDTLVAHVRVRMGAGSED